MRLGFRRGSDRPAEDLLNEAAAALDEGDPQRGLRRAREARAAAAHARQGAEVEASALAVEAAALVDLNRFADAEKAAVRACALAPDDPAGWDELAGARYRLARFEEAAEALDEMLDLDPDDADGWNRLGRAAIWLRDRERAAAAFRRAHELDPERHPIPVRIAAGEFDRLAHASWRTIPPSFRARLHNALVLVEELPGEDEVEEGLDPDTLGIYEGGTALENDIPERIVLYQRNHENVCATLGELTEEIRRTVLHEVGHHFGMEDGELPY